jgi:aminobutyraldehyde dehydrogenase
MTTETALFTVRRAEAALSPALPPFGQFIGGTFVPSSSSETVDIVNPATEEVLTQVPAGTVEDVDAAVAAAVAAKEAWAATTPRDRSAVLLKIADIIEANREVFETLEAANTGKPSAVAEDDISSAIDTFRFSAGAARAYSTLGADDYAENHTSVIHR